MIDIWSGTDYHEELITIHTRSYMHAQCSIIIQCNEEKIKYVIFLTKFHRKINGTGVEQAIFFFLSEQINYKLMSYIMVKIITCIMTIYPGLG